MRLDAPMTDVGLTALSVETRTKTSAPHSPAMRPRVYVASTLFLTASDAFVSIMGTCLCAAACRITCGLCSDITRRMRSASRSEEHTSELQSRQYLVCRLLLEKKT